jgi:uncharacterized membrane protein YfcA
MLILFLAGFIAGADNAVAGGGSILVYPLLLSLGLPPITANATTTAGIWPGTLGSTYGYRGPIQRIPRYYFLLLIPGAIGGLIGAILLGKTSNNAFEYIVPWFIVGASILLALQPRIHRWLLTKAGKRFTKHNHITILTLVGTLLLVTAIYGGYFGAGIGIIMLAFLGMTKLRDIHQMNGLKILMGATVNFMALIYFSLHGMIAWSVVPALASGTILGGWIGATYSSRLPDKLIRKLIVIIGLCLAAILFAKQYLF